MRSHRLLLVLAAVAAAVTWSSLGRGCRRSASHGALLSDKPRLSLRDNLRKDTRYVTALPHDGWSNQVMQAFNLLHLAHKLRQSETTSAQLVPLLPPFIPNDHITAAFVPLLPFSEVFDLDHLSATLAMPIVEFKQLKSVVPCCGNASWARPSDQWRELDQVPNVRDELSCWGTLQTQKKQKRTKPHLLEDVYEIDIAYTPLPRSLLSPRRYRSWAPQAMVHHLLAAFSTPFANNTLRSFYLDPPYYEAREVVETLSGAKFDDNMGDGKAGWRKPELDKEGDILCFQSLFYYSDFSEPEEWIRSKDVSAVWTTVGQHVRWSPRVLSLARDAVRRTLSTRAHAGLWGADWGMADGQSMPQYIGMHIRRGDFLPDCHDGAKCLSVPEYAVQLAHVRRNLAERGVSPDLPVIVGTDETDPEYLAQIRTQGWHLLDHAALDTAARNGEWYPTVLDACIFSMSTGMVGTSRSTMTLLAQRRAQTWHPLFESGLVWF